MKGLTMAAITFTHKGNFNKTRKYLTKQAKLRLENKLTPYAQEGVAALSSATPVRTGKTAASWVSEIIFDDAAETVSICWNNTNENNGENIALLIQYGHGVRGGGYVKGRDYINPAIAPIFDKIVENVWKEVRKA